MKTKLLSMIVITGVGFIGFLVFMSTSGDVHFAANVITSLSFGFNIMTAFTLLQQTE